MSGAELAARITAARALSDDFGRAHEDYRDHGAARPDYPSWAYRLASALDGLLPMIGQAPAVLPPGWRSTMRQALKDAIGYCETKAAEPGAGSEFSEQIGLYRSLARELGIEVGQ
jgi:hypothetical protein